MEFDPSVLFHDFTGPFWLPTTQTAGPELNILSSNFLRVGVVNSYEIFQIDPKVLNS